MARGSEHTLREDDYHYELEQGEKYDVETSTYSSAVESQNDSNSSTVYGDSIVEKTGKHINGLDSVGSGSLASTPAPSVLGIPSIVRSKSHTRGVGACGISRMSSQKSNRSRSQVRQGAAAAGPIVKGPGGPPGPPGGPRGPPKEVFPESDLSKNLVGWEGQDDPLHPRYDQSIDDHKPY
jgi:hypothetical protein